MKPSNTTTKSLYKEKGAASAALYFFLYLLPVANGSFFGDILANKNVFYIFITLEYSLKTEEVFLFWIFYFLFDRLYIGNDIPTSANIK